MSRYSLSANDELKTEVMVLSELLAFAFLKIASRHYTHKKTNCGSDVKILQASVIRFSKIYCMILIIFTNAHEKIFQRRSLADRLYLYQCCPQRAA